MKRTINYMDYKQKLNGDYLETFQTIENYCKSSELSSEHTEDCLNHLFDLFLNAQLDRVHVQEITGNNIELFCTNYIKYKYPNSYIKNLFSNLHLLAWITLLLIGYFLFISSYPEESEASTQKITFVSYYPEESEAFTQKITFGSYFIGILLGVILSSLAKTLLKHIMFKFLKYKNETKTTINVVRFVLLGIVAITVGNLFTLEFSIANLLSACIFYIVCYYFSIIIIKYSKNEKILSSSNTNNQQISINTGAMCRIIPIYVGRYYKKNAKRDKHNRPLLTEQEYMKFLEKRINQLASFLTLLSIIFLITYSAYIFYLFMNYVIRDILNPVIALIALGVFLIWLLTAPIKCRRNLIEILNENDKTIFDKDICHYLIQKSYK